MKALDMCTFVSGVCVRRFYAEYSSHRKLMGKSELIGYAESDDINVSADALLILPTNRQVSRTMAQASAHSAAVPQYSLYAANSSDVM